MNQPQSQKIAFGWRCTREDPGARGTKSSEARLSCNRPISPNIQGGMKKSQYSMMSRRRIGGWLGLSTTLLSAGSGTSLGSEGSHLSLGKGSELVMPLKSHGMVEDPLGPH